MILVSVLLQNAISGLSEVVIAVYSSHDKRKEDEEGPGDRNGTRDTDKRYAAPVAPHPTVGGGRSELVVCEKCERPLFAVLTLTFAGIISLLAKSDGSKVQLLYLMTAHQPEGGVVLSEEGRGVHPGGTGISPPYCAVEGTLILMSPIFLLAVFICAYGIVVSVMADVIGRMVLRITKNGYTQDHPVNSKKDRNAVICNK